MHPWVMGYVLSISSWMDTQILLRITLRKGDSLPMVISLRKSIEILNVMFVYRYPKTSGWDIMLGMNFWGSIYSFIYMFLLPGGGGFEAVQFCQQHPEAAWDILWFCICGAIGQNFIFTTISLFGSLANTTITTVRKFFSILVSSLFSGNPLSNTQWVSVFMVFGGLTYQIYLKWKRTYSKAKSI